MMGDNKRQRKFIIGLLRFMVSFGAIGGILYLFKEQLPDVFVILRGTNPFYFLLAVTVLFAGLLFAAVRLQIILRVHGIRLQFWHAYYVNMIAIFFNNILPSSVGGEMVRGYYLYKNSNGRMESLSALVIDRLVGLITVVGIGLATVLFFGQAATAKILHSIIFVSAATMVLGFLIFNQRVKGLVLAARLPFVPVMMQQKLQHVYQAMHQYRQHLKIFPKCILLTLIAQVSFVIANYFLAESLGITVPLSFFFFLVPILLLLGAAPSINGMGVREAAYLFYLSDYISSDKALALALLTTFFMIFIGIIGGIIYAFKGGLPSPGEESDLGFR